MGSYYTGLSDQSGHKLDGRPYPKTISITSTPAARADTYGRDEVIRASVNFDQNVDASRDVYAVVTKGASRNSQVMDYVLGSGTDTLVFEYEVDINDEGTDGVSIHLPGSLNIKASGTNIAYQSDPGGEIPVLENQSGHKIDGSLVANDTTPPTIFTVRLADRLGAEQDAAYEAGDWIGVEVRFSEGVIAVGEIRLVDGTFQYLFPQLELDIGGVARFAEVGHLSGGDGNYHQVPSLTLVFGYTVHEGDVDENDLVIAHPDGSLVGLDLKGPLGTDANGYDFGPEMLSAGEDGRWVSYVYGNPETRPIGTASVSRTSWSSSNRLAPSMSWDKHPSLAVEA